MMPSFTHRSRGNWTMLYFRVSGSALVFDMSVARCTLSVHSNRMLRSGNGHVKKIFLNFLIVRRIAL